MRKIVFFVFWCLSALAYGQTTDSVVSFNMKPGEKTTWHPFDSCKILRISTMGSAVDALAKPDGSVVLVALKAGSATVVARCGDNASIKAKVHVSETMAADTLKHRQKPTTQVFTGTFAFNPPTDHFFVTYIDRGKKNVVTRGKIGDEESYNDGTGWDRFWNVKTGENWYFNIDKGWIEDVKFDFEPLSMDYAPMNAFATEVNADSLSNAFIGNEMYQGINCWLFFVQKDDGSIVRFWVDPSNGCTLKRQVDGNDPVEVTNYNLDFRAWDFGPHRKKHRNDVAR